MSSIAREYRFNDWRAIYDHPSNKELKALRPNPNALVPGDRVVIPAPVPLSGKYPLGAWHEIRVKSQPTVLRLQLRDMRGAAFANTPYTLEIGNEAREGTLDGDGVLTETVDPSLSSAILRLRPTGPNYDGEIRYNLQLGALDDVSTVSGAQGRLFNLGFYAGPINGRLDDDTRFALRQFQNANGLDPTERLDKPTIDKLTATHDEVT